MSFSNYLENKLLDHVFGSDDMTPPTDTYVALHTADPGETGASSEVSGGSYARVVLANNLTNWPAASGGSKSNGGVVQFPDPTGNWGTITHFSIWDAISGGNCLGKGALSSSKVVNNGDPGPRFPIGSITITLD